eukprot:458661_1
MLHTSKLYDILVKVSLLFIMASFTATVSFYRSGSIADRRILIPATTTNPVVHYSKSTHEAEISIVIAIAVGCSYNISKNTQRFQYDPRLMNVFWYMNVYNYAKCEQNYNYETLMQHHRNIKVIKRNMYQSDFWSEYVTPSRMLQLFGTIDYVWLINEDLMIETFNFNSFVQLSLHFNTSITQPSIMSMCKHCRGSDWRDLNHNPPRSHHSKHRHKTKSNGLVAYTVAVIENMAPLFPFKIYETIQPLMHEQYMVIGKDLKTDWGEFWWCYLVRKSMNGSCVLIYYTPLIHMNTNTYNKTKEYTKEGKTMISRLRKHPTFHKYMPTAKDFSSFAPTQFFMNEFIDTLHYFE